MARDNARGFEWAGSLVGGVAGPRTLKLAMAASTTITEGDAVVFSSGYVDAASSSSGTIAGVAVETKTTGSGENPRILVIPALPFYLFRANTSGTPTQAMVGTLVDIEGSTGAMEVNEDATTEQVVQIVDIDRDGYSDNAFGTANSDVVIRFARTDFGDANAAV